MLQLYSIAGHDLKKLPIIQPIQSVFIYLNFINILINIGL